MTACPDELELARAATEGAEPELAEHLAACTTCRTTWDETARAIELTRSLEVPMPTRDRREEMRTAILAASGAMMATPPARSRAQRWWLVGGAFAAAAALAFVLARPHPIDEPQLQPHGTVTAHAGARFVTSSPAPDEVVTLHDGVIDVEVSPLQPGERFRVVTADTEVEVRGTAFEVAAELGHVTRVDVRHGVVEVRPHDGAVVILAAGEVWTAPIRTAAFSRHSAGIYVDRDTDHDTDRDTDHPGGTDHVDGTEHFHDTGTPVGTCADHPLRRDPRSPRDSVRARRAGHHQGTARDRGGPVARTCAGDHTSRHGACLRRGVGRDAQQAVRACRVDVRTRGDPRSRGPARRGRQLLVPGRARPREAQRSGLRVPRVPRALPELGARLRGERDARLAARRGEAARGSRAPVPRGDR